MNTHISNARSSKKSVRMALAVGSLAVFAGCSSATRTATQPAAVETATTTITTAASPADSVEPAATQPPMATTTVATTTVATTTVATTTANQVPDSDPVAAVDGNGDAVVVGPDGTAIVLYDGVDPDDPAPAEGPSVLVDGIAVTNDLATSIVGTCCEPSPGSLIVTNSADPANPLVGFGRSPVISPDQKQLAAITDKSIVVSWLDLSSPLHSEEVRPLDSIADIEWADDTHVISLVLGHTYSFLTRYLVTDEGLVETESGGGPLLYSIVGVSDGVLYALEAGNVVDAFAADTLTPLPDRAITLTEAPASASIHDGELRWVDQERRLHIGDAIVPGEYIAVA